MDNHENTHERSMSSFATQYAMDQVMASIRNDQLDEKDEYPHPHPLRTTWQTLRAAGEPSSTIRITNLASTITGPSDAWGRPNRLQPVYVSVEVSLSKPFTSSSSGDVLRQDTVHYGLLSKHILKTLGEGACGDLASVIMTLRGSLLGPPVVEEWRGQTEPGFLDGKGVKYLKISVHLPKASKLGSGVSMVDSMAFEDGKEVIAWARKLVFHDLRVPVLIGVNDNEREAKQMVVANVEVDRWAPHEDAYSKIEEAITSAMAHSSFETLEALASKVCTNLDDYFKPRFQSGVEGGFRFKVSLEKPIAVPLADAPCVEFNVDQEDLWKR